MNLEIDLRVAELMASRLCHDLVGPIGAVGNGMELMADDEFGMADDAMRLAADSATHATDKLQFFRMAYGMAGSRHGNDLVPLRELAAGFLAHGKVELDWPPPPEAIALPDGAGKAILNMVALAEEALPRGGVVRVSLAAAAEGFDILCTARGQDAGLREETEAGLADGVAADDLTPRNVHAYFTKLVARRLGGVLERAKPEPDLLTLTLRL